jgi:CRISPR-associated protein Cas1
MDGIFDAITSEERLRDAWLRVKRNKGVAGADYVSVAAFEGKLATNLARLRDLLRSGQYRPMRLFRVTMAKPSGGVREIGIPCVVDRVAQAAVALVFDELFDPLMSDASFAYRRNRSVEHAIGRVMTYRLWGFDWLLDGDIAAYFDSILHTGLSEQLRDLVACWRTLKLIDRWLARFSKNGVGIAQGSPLSPFLANLYLTPIDHAIHSRRVRLIRYSDDFILMTKSQGAAEWAKLRMATLLAERGLRLSEEKTSVRQFSADVEFLGYRFAANGGLVRRATS